MTTHDRLEDRRIDRGLARLADWQPPAGFAHRVAALAAAEIRHARSPGIALVLRGLALAACVSIAAWLGGEMLSAGLQSAVGRQSPGAVSWVLALASVVFVWRCIPRNRRLARPPVSRITS